MLTVSIVTYHTDEDELRQCLESLNTEIVKRIFIVDNGSEERLRLFAGGFDKVEYIASENVGYGAAHNKAIRRAIADGARYHLVVNSDVRFNPETLDRIAGVMDRRPEIGQLQPKIVYPDGRLQPTVRLLPTPLDVFGRRFLPKWLMRRRNERYLLSEFDHSRELNVAYHQGSFMFLRVDALRHTGLFDERFFMYPEDIDLTRRIHTGYLTLYYPSETVVHCHRAASYRNLRLLAIHCINMARYFNKWGWFSDRERRRVNREILSDINAR